MPTFTLMLIIFEALYLAWFLLDPNNVYGYFWELSPLFIIFILVLSYLWKFFVYDRQTYTDDVEVSSYAPEPLKSLATVDKVRITEELERVRELVQVCIASLPSTDKYSRLHSVSLCLTHAKTVLRDDVSNFTLSFGVKSPDTTEQTTTKQNIG